MEKTLDERVKTKIEKMQQNPKKCLSSVNWFSLKDKINENHLKLVVDAFYNLPTMREHYENKKPVDELCESYLFNHTMKFYNEGKDVLEIMQKFPPRFKDRFVSEMLMKKRNFVGDVLEYLYKLD